MRGGRYSFDASKLSDAHDSAQKMFLNHASKGYSPLIIDNTNMKYWEMFCYLQGAAQYHYAIHVIEPITPWRWNPSVLAQKNKHGVPMDKIKIMKGNYESGVSLDQILSSLNIQPVAKPKLRDVPPISLIELQDENIGSAIVVPQQVDRNANYHETNPFKWTQPPQVFPEKWDQPTEKEETNKVKEDKVQLPQPQRKQRKDKNDPNFVPHRRNCPYENEKFTQLRELYPDVTDSYIWDLFVQCKGDPNWVAEILCEDNKTQDMQNGDDLSCDCGIQKSSSSSSSDAASPVSKKVLQSNNARKNTPVKTKKVKSVNSESLATKAAIEASIRIDEKFYPEHVRAVKTWKTPLLPTPTTSGMENGQPPPPTNELVDLTIDKRLIFELDDRFGDGLLKFAQREFPERIFVNESTARQLYEQIMEVFKSQEAESQLEAVKNDLAFAQQLAEIERTEKYPKLFDETSGNLKDIMEREEALNNYERDMNGWQKENETLAIVIKKQRLYKAFPGVPQIEVNNLFEVLEYNFSETVKMLQENLGYNNDQCKKVKDQLDNDKLWRSESSSEGEDAEEEAEDPNSENGVFKNIENLREEIQYHHDERHNCNRIQAEKRQAKDFHTASYYANMAALHKQFAEEKTLEVSSALAALHAQNQITPTQVDLHYHNITEASTILHTFLDRNISRLHDIKKPYEDLSIITGRGAHSKGGIATIKNMTYQLLKERNLR